MQEGEDMRENEDCLEKFHDFIYKLDKRIMVASIFILTVGALISLFLLMLRIPIASLAIFCYVFGIFIGLISAEALMYKIMGIKND